MSGLDTIIEGVLLGGVYALFDRLRAAHPQVEFESCASGGGRIDAGILTRCGRVWLSDSNDAIERLRIQHHAAMLLPACVTALLMPFTYSIANGIGVGFISFTLMSLFAGKAKDIHWLMWLISALFVVYFAQGPILAALG